MTDELAVAIATLITAMGAVLVSLVNARRANQAADAALEAKHAAEESQAAIIATKDGVFEVGKQLDGRLSQLLRLTESTAFAAGKLAGEESGQQREPS